MRNERLLASVIWLSIAVWLLSTIYGFFSQTLSLDSSNYFPHTFSYLRNLVLILLLGVAATFSMIRWTRYETKKQLAEHKIPGAKSSMGPFPKQWEKINIPAAWLPIDGSEYPKLSAYISHVVSITKSPPKGFDPVVLAMFNATLETLRVLNGKPGLPASSRIGAHGDVTLPQHCYRVAECGFDVYETFHYEGYKPHARTLKAIKPNDPNSQGRALFSPGVISLELFILTCLSHDIGKLRTFQTTIPKRPIFTFRGNTDQKYVITKVIGDHGPVGSRLLAKLPCFNSIPYHLRSYIFSAIAHYHDPDTLPQAVNSHNDFVVKCDATQALMLALIDADKAGCAAEKTDPEDYPDSHVYYNPMNHRPLYEAVMNAILPGQGNQPYNHSASPNFIGHVSGDCIYIDFRKLYDRVVAHLDIQSEVATYGSSKDNEIHRSILQLLFAEGILATHLSGKIYPATKAVFESVVTPPPKMNKEQYELFKKGKPVEFTQAQLDQAAGNVISVKRTIVLLKRASVFAGARLPDSPSEVALSSCVYGEGTSLTVEQEENQRTRLKKRKLIEIAFDKAYQADRSEGKITFDLTAALTKIDTEYPFILEDDPRHAASYSDGTETAADISGDLLPCPAPETATPSASKSASTDPAKPKTAKPKPNSRNSKHMVPMGEMEKAPDADNPFSASAKENSQRLKSALAAGLSKSLPAPNDEAPWSTEEPDIIDESEMVEDSVISEDPGIDDEFEAFDEADEAIAELEEPEHYDEPDATPTIKTAIPGDADDIYGFLENDDDLFAPATSAPTRQVIDVKPPVISPSINEPATSDEEELEPEHNSHRKPQLTVDVDDDDERDRLAAISEAQRIKAEAAALAIESFPLGHHSFKAGDDRRSNAAKSSPVAKKALQAPLQKSPINEGVTLAECAPKATFTVSSSPAPKQRKRQTADSGTARPSQAPASPFRVPSSPAPKQKPLTGPQEAVPHQIAKSEATPPLPFVDSSLSPETITPSPVAQVAMPRFDSLAPIQDPQVASTDVMQEEQAPASVQLRVNSLINDDPMLAAKANPGAFMGSNREAIHTHVASIKDKYGFPLATKLNTAKPGSPETIYLTIPISLIEMPYVSELLADESFTKRLRRTPSKATQSIYIFLNSAGQECLAVRE
jgi:hypothetical protein